jgi:hypothetical protein
MPTSSRCRCHLCRPERLDHPVDRKTVATVRKNGFAVVAVGTGACDHCGDCPPPRSDGPAFAYTIGLPHRAGHPELVVSGLSAELMSSMLQEGARRVLEGFRFEPGTTAENLVRHWPVVADPMSLQGLKDTVLWSRWFHRGRVRALQLVWPDTRGIFAWQPGAPAFVSEGQPQEWRLPQERCGPLAADPAWVFPVPPDHVAVGCACIVEEGAPVRFVARELDPLGCEFWLALCGEEHADISAVARPYHFAHLVRRAPSLGEVADLALHQQAERETCWAPWFRVFTPPE